MVGSPDVKLRQAESTSMSRRFDSFVVFAAQIIVCRPVGFMIEGLPTFGVHCPGVFLPKGKYLGRAACYL